jgi:cytochrome c peroxidase
VAEAIAAYERTLLSRDSPFDRFIKGDTSAITDSQKRGWRLFQGKATCVDCHRFTLASPFFTDAQFHNTGVFAREQRFDELEQRAREINALSIKSVVQLTHRPDYSELGRFLVTREPGDIGAYKTPTLRDVELTWPYMHDGSIRTLLDVVKFYNRGGNQNAYLDPKIHPLNLTQEEMSDLVEFMRALTSDEVLRMVQSSTPQERVRISTQP